MKPHRLVAMPAGVSVYNASSERCDMAYGPCACGAWHDADDWRYGLREGRVSRAQYRRVADAIKSACNRAAAEAP